VVTIGAGTVTLGASTSQIGSVTASISNSLTISSLPAISGTVTANVAGNLNNTIEYYDEGSAEYVVGVHIKDVGNNILGGGTPLAISGTVTANINTFPDATTIGEQIAQGFTNYGSFDVAISGTANVSGTVTLGASTSQIGSVTASISNSVVTFYPMQGTSVSNTNFTSVTASTTLVSAVAGREVLTVFNEGAGNLHISAGSTCTTVAYQVRLSAGDYWECPNGQLSLAHTAVFATAGTARVTQVS
jgi:hypothetical protein